MCGSSSINKIKKLFDFHLSEVKQKGVYPPINGLAKRTERATTNP
jgi:hypothetical protein